MTGSADRSITDLPEVARRVRTEAAAARRTHDRHLRAVEASETSLAAAVRGWANRADHVRIDTASGSTSQGTISLVGRDAIAIGPTLVRLTSIVAVHTACRDLAEAGADSGLERPSFAALVASLAATRPLVRVGRPGAAPVEGELRSGNEELIVVVEPGSTDSVVLPIGQVSELTVLASG